MTKRFFCSVQFIILLFSISLFSQSLDEKKIRLYLDEKEKVFEEISVQMGIANWNVYSREGEADQDTPKGRFYKLFNDAELNSSIEKWSENLEIIKDDVLRKRIDLWSDILTGAKVDMDQEIFKLENELEAKLSQSDSDNEDNSESVLKLMKLRNAKARSIGYSDYAEMSLELSGIGAENFEIFYRDMLKRTEAPYKKLLDEIGREASINDVQRFVGMYYRNSGGGGIEKEKQMDVMKETLANIGFEFDKLPIRFVEKEIPYGGNALAINIPNDMRIILNVGMPLSVWMHELGHGLHGVHTTIQSPILKGYEWNLGGQCPAFGEGMAEVSAGFIGNKEWQIKYTGLSEEEISERFEQLKKYIPGYLRYFFTAVMFEIEFYKNPDQDPKKLRDKINKDLLQIDTSDMPFSLSNNIMYVSYPVYMQNYIFAEIIAFQVHQTLEQKFGNNYMFNKKVGSWLVENMYADGELRFWKNKLKNATGKELDVERYFGYYGL